MKRILVTRKQSLSKKRNLITRKEFLSQEKNSCQKKKILVKIIDFLSQEKYTCHKKNKKILKGETQKLASGILFEALGAEKAIQKINVL